MFILSHILWFLGIVCLITFGKYVNYYTRKVGYKEYILFPPLQKMVPKVHFIILCYFTATWVIWFRVFLKASWVLISNHPEIYLIYHRSYIYLILLVKIIVLMKYIWVPDKKEGYFIFYCGLLILLDWITLLTAETIVDNILGAPDMLGKTLDNAVMSIVWKLLFIFNGEVTFFKFFYRLSVIIILILYFMSLYFIYFFPIFLFFFILYYIYITEKKINDYDNDDDENNNNNF